jgi:hypothetical protein
MEKTLKLKVEACPISSEYTKTRLEGLLTCKTTAEIEWFIQSIYEDGYEDGVNSQDEFENGEEKDSFK